MYCHVLLPDYNRGMVHEKHKNKHKKVGEVVDVSWEAEQVQAHHEGKRTCGGETAQHRCSVQSDSRMDHFK